MTTTEIKIDSKKVSRHKATLTARAGDQVLHVDEVNPASVKARATYLDALAARCPGADRQALEDELLRIADLHAKQPEPEAGKARTNGTALALADPEPWPDEVDGAALLSDIAAVVQRFARLPQHAPECLALWALFAHAHDAFQVSPILLLTSPVKQCGKTRVLELLEGLLPRPLVTSSITPAALYRTVERYTPSLLIDEFDTQRQDNEDLRGIINSGWQRSSARATRVAGEGADLEPRFYSTWCPKVLAGIGTPWDTVLDRSIVIRMQRKGPGEEVERWRADRGPAIMGPLCRRAARWAADHLEELRDADPAMPQIASDRAADNWRCLLAVADLAGGPWPLLTRTAAETMSAIPAEDSARILLLSDLRDLFTSRATDRLTSQEVADRLGELEDKPWPEWKGKPITKAQVAKLLSPFDVKTRDLRQPSNAVVKGYLRSDLEPVFAKYLSTPPARNATPLQDGNNTGNQPDRNATRSGLEEPNPKPDRACSGVADEKGGGEGSDSQRGLFVAPRAKRIFVQDRTSVAEAPRESPAPVAPDKSFVDV